ncbi:hypothetical protein X727_33635 [Mesorhizobium sp. L103C119B0]|nr:hypothetical protein X727_33635 [Mesorhizobium sp. L103C119B0]
MLILSVLLALDQASKTGNYTVLRGLGSPNFQSNSGVGLGDIFASLREQELDLSAVAVLEPRVTLLPQVEPNGTLHMAVFFPIGAAAGHFELLFEPANRQWKIYGVSVNLTSGGPQALDIQRAAEASRYRTVSDAQTRAVKLNEHQTD